MCVCDAVFGYQMQRGGVSMFLFAEVVDTDVFGNPIEPRSDGWSPRKLLMEQNARSHVSWVKSFVSSGSLTRPWM